MLVTDIRNPNDLREGLDESLVDGVKVVSEIFTGPLWLESDTGAETDYIYLETDVGLTDYIELEAT